MINCMASSKKWWKMSPEDRYSDVQKYILKIIDSEDPVKIRQEFWNGGETPTETKKKTKTRARPPVKPPAKKRARTSRAPAKTSKAKKNDDAPKKQKSRPKKENLPKRVKQSHFMLYFRAVSDVMIKQDEHEYTSAYHKKCAPFLDPTFKQLCRDNKVKAPTMVNMGNAFKEIYEQHYRDFAQCIYVHSKKCVASFLWHILFNEQNRGKPEKSLKSMQQVKREHNTTIKATKA